MPERGVKPKRKEVSWSPRLAYAVGLMATDGCLSVDGRHIDLTSKDKEQLENFMRCIDKEIPITHKISGYTKKPVTRIQFSDVGLYNFFVSIGLTSRKTKTIGELIIPDDVFFDFLRGHLDGDGCFYSYYDTRWKNSFMFYLLFMSASKSHVVWIRATIQRLSGARGHITHAGKKGREIYTVRYGKAASLAICERLYANPTSICLTRKRLKIVRALGIVGLTLPKGRGE